VIEATPDRIRQDRRLIGQTLFKLALPRLIVLAVGIVIAVAVWLYASSWLLNLGSRVGLDWLHVLGPQGADFLKRIIDPYLWWALVVIWTIIVLAIVKSWVASSLAAGRLYALDDRILSQIRPRLCDEAVDVIRWVWTDRAEPFTVGDLQRVHRELRSNRIGKIALVRAQSAILDQADEPLEPTGSARGARPEPSLGRAR
jgi:hypothetical protein